MGRYKCVLCKASRWTIRRRRRVDHFSMMYTGCVRKRLTVGAKFFCVFFHIRFSCFYRDYSGGDCSILKNRYQLIIYKKCIDKFYIEWLFFLLNLFFPPPPPLKCHLRGGFIIKCAFLIEQAVFLTVRVRQWCIAITLYKNNILRDTINVHFIGIV